MELCFLFFLFFSSVYGELLPEFKLKRASEAYLKNERSTVVDCSLRNYKWGGSTLISAALLHKVFFTEFPHLVALGWKLEKEVVWKCTGSLITSKYVLTSASCTLREGKPPDTARLGDFNLSDSAGNYTQQFSIAEIMPHPKYQLDTKYHDIALLRLNASVKIHITAAPACLWITDDIKFKDLETAGWNLRSEKIFQHLSKTKMPIISNKDCIKSFSKSDEFQERIVGSQLCTNSTRQSGDPGSPLEIKLFGQHKLIPFLIGINSFYNPLANKTVHTRISSYIPWIESIVNESFDPTECALRHIDDRQHDPIFYVDRNFSYSNENHQLESDFVTIVPRTFLITNAPQNYRVRLVDLNETHDEFTCGGSIIDEYFVLTTASCIKKFSKGPNAVVAGPADKALKFEISEVYVHPKYNVIHNDIALLRLKDKIIFEKSLQLACPWPSADIPARLNNYGHGPQSINLYGTDSKKVDLSIKSDLLNSTTCNADLPGSGDEICVGNAQHIIPRSCEVDLGSSVTRAVFDHNKYFPFVFGLSSSGDDCGFGAPIVATRVSSYIKWIDSIMFSNSNAKEISAGNGSEIETEFEECFNRNLEHREDSTEHTNNINNQNHNSFSSSLALIGYSGTDSATVWSCDGAIVSHNFIITSASSARTNNTFPTTVLVGPNHNKTEQQLMHIVKVFLHPKYDATNGENNIALLKTDHSIRFDGSVSPACLWYNTTHLPFFLGKPLWSLTGNDVAATNIGMNTISNSNCAAALNETFAVSYFCADYQFELECKWTHDDIVKNTLCSSEHCSESQGEIILSFIPAKNKLTPVLVGVSATKNYCNTDLPIKFTRISFYREWIKSVMAL